MAAQRPAPFTVRAIDGNAAGHSHRQGLLQAVAEPVQGIGGGINGPDPGRQLGAVVVAALLHGATAGGGVAKTTDEPCAGVALLRYAHQESCPPSLASLTLTLSYLLNTRCTSTLATSAIWSQMKA